MAKDNTQTNVKRKTRVSQSDLPQAKLSEAVKIPHAIWDNYAGDATPPHEVAIALNISPTSSTWRVLTGAAVAYGLTRGAYNADSIELTDLGRRFVSPQVEGEDDAALAQAAMIPAIPSEFYKKYNRAKWPKPEIAANVLIGFGVPKEKAGEIVKLVEENARLVGFIRETKTGPFVSVENPVRNTDTDITADNNHVPEKEKVETLTDEEVFDAVGLVQPNVQLSHPIAIKEQNNRVFITHGKDISTMEQIKQVVELGGFTPVVSVQRETGAKAVPDKVMDDMRSCNAAIIHVSSETKITDIDGKIHTQINPNVLIEIGAAMALYRDRFILVVEDGIDLPSNLQGLYQSRYSGKELTLDAGMKILKALRGLKES